MRSGGSLADSRAAADWEGQSCSGLETGQCRSFPGRPSVTPSPSHQGQDVPTLKLQPPPERAALAFIWKNKDIRDQSKKKGHGTPGEHCELRGPSSVSVSGPGQPPPRANDRKLLC